MEPKPHPLWANATAREIVNQLDLAETIEEWNLVLSEIVSFLVTASAPRPAADWPEWWRRGHALEMTIRAGFKPKPRRGRRPISRLRALEDIHQIRMTGEGATLDDAARRLRSASRERITMAAARKRVLNAEKVGGFRLPRKGPFGRKGRV